MLRRRPVVLIVAVIAVVLGFAGYRLTRHETPNTQPPLGHLSAAALPALQADFNRSVDQTRIIVLLSPT